MAFVETGLELELAAAGQPPELQLHIHQVTVRYLRLRAEGYIAWSTIATTVTPAYGIVILTHDFCTLGLRMYVTLRDEK